MERYGDYNEVDEAPGQSPVLKIIKILAAVICFSVIGFIGFRIFTFNYYPDSTKNLSFTNALTEHYNARGGDITVYTQKLAAAYDDNKEGNFFCDHLRFVPEAGTLQVTLRYNTSLYEDIEKKYGVKLSDDSRDSFHFRLTRSGGDKETGRLVIAEWDEFLMYRYVKLVFEDVELDEVLAATSEDWIRLDVQIDGVQDKDEKTGVKTDHIFRILVLDNVEKYTAIKEYEPTDGEVPV